MPRVLKALYEISMTSNYLAFEKNFALKKRVGPPGLGPSLQASPQAGKFDKGRGIV